uniref:NKAP domain containing 1 n=1 Tax=Doryrhamphus excisus TaxID=161450 RepID=UPI0025ADD889|nr:NKAP domain containing 1 [Doryrhamphus excisus]XP_057936142.1 NKAP domain containing 1 [Doryrhamphus excisus]
MSKQTLGKTLLRNVIRHTDAHNKIQEETEMWKMRDLEVNHVSATKPIRGHMHCDRISYQSRVSSDHDDREARYWSRKLYEFEDNDPDRWGHSGFKELYPEEFESDSDKSSTTKTGHHRSEASKSKHSKKSSHKKKKKRKKEAQEAKRRRSEWSSGDRSSDDSNMDKEKRRETKSRHKNKKRDKTKDRRNEDGDDEGRGRRAHGHKRKNQDSHKRSDSSKKRRKDWRATGEESSEESSGE